MLKLKDLKNVINTDFIIYDVRANSYYAYITIDSQIFENYSEFEVVAIGAIHDSNNLKGLVISIR